MSGSRKPGADGEARGPKNIGRGAVERRSAGGRSRDRSRTIDLVADLHTHTVSSGHAADTARTIGEFAVRRGLEGVAITDHGPGISGGASAIYFMALKRVARGIGLPVRIITGVEDDIRNGKGELTLPVEVLESLEIVMTGCHPMSWIAGRSPRARTDAVAAALGRGHVKVFTHPVGTYYEIDLDEVAAAAKAHGVALELNASKLGQREALVRLLEKCASDGISIVVNSDAHVADEVGDFDAARGLLEEVSFPAHLVVNRSVESISSFFGFTW